MFFNCWSLVYSLVGPSQVLPDQKVAVDAMGSYGNALECRFLKDSLAEGPDAVSNVYFGERCFFVAINGKSKIYGIEIDDYHWSDSYWWLSLIVLAIALSVLCFLKKQWSTVNIPWQRAGNAFPHRGWMMAHQAVGRRRASSSTSRTTLPKPARTETVRPR